MNTEGNRAINLYGEHNARVSIYQTRLEGVPEPEQIPMFRVISVLLWNIPDAHYSALCEHWVDKIAYNRTWRPFAQETADKTKHAIMQVSRFHAIIQYDLIELRIRDALSFCEYWDKSQDYLLIEIKNIAHLYHRVGKLRKFDDIRKHGNRRICHRFFYGTRSNGNRDPNEYGVLQTH